MKERPRERLLSQGAEALTDSELVAILLRVGFKGTSAVELARQLLLSFGSLRAMAEAPVLALLDVKGLKGARAAQLLAAIEIKTFKSEAIVREPLREKGNRETLSMVMLDYDFDSESDLFNFDDVFYAEAIEKAGWEIRFPLESLGKQVMAVFVDIYGNEARELIPAERFGAGAKTAAKPARKSQRSKKGAAG